MDLAKVQPWENPPQHSLSSADKFDLFWECHAPELSRIFEQEREILEADDMKFGEFVKEVWAEIAS